VDYSQCCIEGPVVSVPSFYTRKGDQGYTDLLGGRVPKYDPQPEAVGTLDEATASIGLARAVASSERTKSILMDVQRDLYLMMAELAFTSDMTQTRYHITQEHLDRIEQQTDRLSAEVDLPPHFILPGDTVPGAALDVARTVVRRAERLVVKLYHDEILENELVPAYLNRLSSLMFILGRFEDHEAGVTPTRAKSS
jgi:cob(I)alamin adenosyltransferase